MDNKLFRKRYHLRKAGDLGYNCIVSIPPEVIKSEAAKCNQDRDTYIQTHDVICFYSSAVSGLSYAFVEAVKPKFGNQFLLGTHTGH